MEKKLLMLLLVFSLVGLTACDQVVGNTLVGSPVYPQSVDYDDFAGKDQIREDNMLADDFKGALNEFVYRTSAEVLQGQAENVNYSPISLYMALALAAYGADGETAKEMFTLLGIDDENRDYLSEQMAKLYRSIYTDNEIGALKLANSLWLQTGHPFKEGFIENATANFYSSIHQADFKEQATATAMSQWIAEQTNGLLTPEFAVNPDQVMAIINTIYFKDQWVNSFDEGNTSEDLFYLQGGQTITADFMLHTYGNHGYVKGDGFTSSSLPFKNGGKMVFVLPDEAVDVDELLKDASSVKELFDQQNSKSADVVFQIPKFSFDSSLDLKSMLQTLGMTSAFQANANFQNITDERVNISDIKQESRIAINEYGAEAAAFTKVDISVTSMPMPSEMKVEMILDRPFIYGITSEDGTLLFVGVCQNPK